MAKSVIPENKHRYSLCLTKENYEWLHHFVTKECKQPRSQIGIMIDEMIVSLKDEVQPILDIKAKEGRMPTTAEMMILLGQSIQNSAKHLKE